MKLSMFRTVPLSIIRCFSLYTQQRYMSYRLCWLLVSRSKCSCSQAVSKPVWHIPLLCVQWKTPDDGQRNCPKHVESHSKNKFEKLVHLVGFVISKWWISGWLSYCGIPWYEAVLFGLWVQAFRMYKLLPYSDETEGGNTSTFLRNVSIYLHLPDYTTSWTFVAVTAHL